MEQLAPVVSALRGFAGRVFLDIAYGSLPPVDGAFRRAVLWDDEGSTVAREVLVSGKPCLLARLGSSELGCVSYYTRWRERRILPAPYPSQLRRIMRVNAGVFPVDDASLDRFAEVFLGGVAQADVMGVWFNRNEDRIVERYCPEARLVQLEAFNCVLRTNPWSAELAGKIVLVVHPFAKTIQQQYQTRRALLFANPEVLPEFELKTLAAVQSAAGGDSGHPSWFAALEDMTEQVAGIDFDVAIIGAGAYGLPLGAAVKAMGRQAVHLGAATQLLFGVRGRRWEVESPHDIARLFNEHWVRPSQDETPPDAQSVEGGCYW